MPPVASPRSEQGWIPFDTPVRFETRSPRTGKPRTGTPRSNSSRHGRNKQTRRTASSRASSPRWMDQPVNADASWVALQPPPPPPPPSGRSSRRDPDGTSGSTARQSPMIPRSPRISRESRQVSLSSTEQTHPASTSGESSSSSSSVSREQTAARGRSLNRSLNNSRGRARSLQFDPPEEGQRRSESRRSRSTSRPRRQDSSPARTPRPRLRPPIETIEGRDTERNNVPRSRSKSRQRKAIPISPNQTRPTNPTQRLPPRPSRANRESSEVSHEDKNIGRDISFGRPRLQRRLSLGDSSATNSLRGIRDDRSVTNSIGRSMGVGNGQFPIHSRILLSATIYHNEATNLWIATINTNQRGVARNPKKASKFLKAFSFPSEREARESAIANAPPKMLPFNESPLCFLCNSKFAVFKRASHCRNCGVCVCKGCTVTWPSACLPSTYNLKNESRMRVCQACDSISTGFKQALLQGNFEDAIEYFGTGNVNLRTPFPISRTDKRDEAMYPIHCAVEGGNISIVRWLLEDKYCPIRKVAAGSNKKKIGDLPIATSKNRSVLNIAMSGLKVDILRYLVVERNVSVYETKDLNLALRSLESVLLAIPTAGLSTRTIREDYAEESVRWDDGYFDDDIEFAEVDDECSSLGEDQSEEWVDAVETESQQEKANNGSSADICIICYDNAIDCVMTPCGHQICCLECGANLKVCPVCNGNSEVIRIFRP